MCNDSCDIHVVLQLCDNDVAKILSSVLLKSNTLGKFGDSNYIMWTKKKQMFVACDKLMTWHIRLTN